MPGIKPGAPFRQLLPVLREQIDAGVYPRGRRMPSQATLATLYGVSRDVMRNALEQLHQEGLLIPRLGDGSYVAITAGEGETEQDRLWSTTMAAVLSSGVSTPEIAHRMRMRRATVASRLHRRYPLTARFARRIINAVTDPAE